MEQELVFEGDKDRVETILRRQVRKYAYLMSR